MPKFIQICVVINAMDPEENTYSHTIYALDDEGFVWDTDANYLGDGRNFHKFEPLGGHPDDESMKKDEENYQAWLKEYHAKNNVK